ncbi:MAG: DUF4476 domain-containing protein, partial [Bacteroidota bacterium]
SVITSNCISVSQLSQLLDFFEFDDTRLSLVELSQNHLFDLDNLAKLGEKFTFSRSRERFEQLLKEF